MKLAGVQVAANTSVENVRRTKAQQKDIGRRYFHINLFLLITFNFFFPFSLEKKKSFLLCSPKLSSYLC